MMTSVQTHTESKVYRAMQFWRYHENFQEMIFQPNFQMSYLHGQNRNWKAKVTKKSKRAVIPISGLIWDIFLPILVNFTLWRQIFGKSVVFPLRYNSTFRFFCHFFFWIAILSVKIWHLEIRWGMDWKIISWRFSWYLQNCIAL